MNYIIKKARVIDPASNVDEIKDIFVTDGKIAAAPAPGAEVIAAAGLICAPGFVDMHVHLREPGFEGKETVATGTMSALKGGFTTVAMMPNTNPAMDSATHINLAKEIIKNTANINVEILGTITKGRACGELTDFAALKAAGAVGLTDDGSCVEDDALMKRAFKEAVKNDILLISHAEDTKLVRGGVMHEGFIASKLGLKPISSASEYEMVRRDAELARGLDARIHIAHVSVKESVEIIKKAKAAGVKITCEVTPHHFTLTDEACQSFDGNTKMNPPLRARADVEAIKEAVKDGTIDVIATDHAPHAVHEKEVEFDLAYFGIIGSETALGLAMTELVDAKVITINKMIDMLTAAPARLLGIKKGTLSVGADADITLFNPEEKWVYSKEEILSRSQNTPFIGRELKGRVKYVFVGGALKYERN